MEAEKRKEGCRVSQSSYLLLLEQLDSSGSREVLGTGWSGERQEALWAPMQEGESKSYHSTGHGEP